MIKLKDLTCLEGRKQQQWMTFEAYSKYPNFFALHINEYNKRGIFLWTHYNQPLYEHQQSQQNIIQAYVKTITVL